MKHKIGFNRLGRKASHRKAMCRNMVTSLFDHERITTTKSKALEVRRIAEKMITRAKTDSVHNRRIVAKDISSKKVLAKLFTTIGPRFVKRAGGYTRILKIGFRQGDAAEMVLLELVEKTSDEKTRKKAKAVKTAKTENVTKESTEKEAVASTDTTEKKSPGKKKEPVDAVAVGKEPTDVE